MYAKYIIKIIRYFFRNLFQFAFSRDFTIRLDLFESEQVQLYLKQNLKLKKRIDKNNMKVFMIKSYSTIYIIVP